MISGQSFSRSFGMVLCEADRKELLTSLGLGSLSFELIERSGKRMLRGRRVNNGMVEALLAVPKGNVTELDLPRVTIWYPEEELLVQPLSGVPALWELIFPQPFGRLYRVIQHSAQIRVEVSSQDFRHQLEGLNSVLRQLEDRFSMTELSCLYIKGANGSFPLLLQFVRHRLSGAGTAGSLGDLAELFEIGGLTSEDLHDWFGTNVTYLHFEPPSDVSPPNRLAALAEALEGAMGDEKRLLGGPRPGDAATSYELGL